MKHPKMVYLRMFFFGIVRRVLLESSRASLLVSIASESMEIA